ncbi:hypothetical protein [Ignavibacterium sp.]|uniref:hypothetical protein n=1 Tax=Ignavibacterium sp. TaxID=2651167 RepID=UPI00307EC65C
MKVNKKIATIFFAVVSLFFASCSEDTDGFGEYYEGTFSDEVVFNFIPDSSFIILEQLGIVSRIKENVPYSIEDDQSLIDSIKLKMFVSYGSYNQNPKVIKQTSQNNDSVYVWYSTRNKYYKTLSKSNTIAEVETSPKLEYVSVDSLVIYKAENKFIKFFSRVVK